MKFETFSIHEFKKYLYFLFIKFSWNIIVQIIKKNNPYTTITKLTLIKLLHRRKPSLPVKLTVDTIPMYSSSFYGFICPSNQTHFSFASVLFFPFYWWYGLLVFFISQHAGMMNWWHLGKGRKKISKACSVVE
jgi:hypothetical protein